MNGIRTTTTASASASSSLAYQHFIAKISGPALVLQHLVSSKISTVMPIPISFLLRVSKSLLYFQKRCWSKHDYTRPILRNTVVFGSGDGIEGLLSNKYALYDFSHADVRLGHLILGDIISLLFRHSGGREGGGGGMNAALPHERTVLQIITISLLDLWSSYVRYGKSSNYH